MKNQWIMTLVMALVVGGIAFYGGMQYQQSKTPTGGALGQGFRSGGGNGQLRARNGQNGMAVRGEIISSDANSITVKLPDGSTKIVIVSVSTNVMQATSATKDDLKIGQMVAVFGTPDSDGSVTAQNIQLNPMMGRGGFGGGDGGQRAQSSPSQ